MRKLQPPLDKRLKYLTDGSKKLLSFLSEEIEERSNSRTSRFLTSKDIRQKVTSNNLYFTLKYVQGNDFPAQISTNRIIMEVFPYFPTGLIAIAGSKRLPPELKRTVEGMDYNITHRLKDKSKHLNKINVEGNSKTEPTIYFNLERSYEIYTAEFLQILFTRGVHRSTLQYMTKFDKDKLEELLFDGCI